MTRNTEKEFDLFETEDTEAEDIGIRIVKTVSFYGIPVATIMICLLSSFYTVEQGDRAVVLRFGEIIAVTEPGLHLKFPLIDEVKDMSVRTKKLSTTFAVYSKDIQGADVVQSVNYSLSPSGVDSIYKQYGQDYEERVILPQLLSKSKDAFGQKNAVETIQAREVLSKQILDELQNYFHGLPIIIESVQLENIDFSDVYEKSVEERMQAEVEVARVRQNYEREKVSADMARTTAAGKADAALTEATAQAKAIALLGQAEADAIQAKTKALANNPDYVLLIQAEKWNGILPATMIPNGTVPIINAK